MLFTSENRRPRFSRFVPSGDAQGSASPIEILVPSGDRPHKPNHQPSEEPIPLSFNGETKFFLGKSTAMQKLFVQLKTVAAHNDVPVSLHGETGTGKEMAARTIHQFSSRKAGPFLAINCAAIPRDLIESTLFGHEKGAFTGAITRQEGAFEYADKGVILLDEIGDMPLDMQSRLLRVLDGHIINRVGSHKEIPVDVRIITATNKNLQRCVTQGTFREDLFFRLNVFDMKLPPLRERPEDIPALAEHFLRKYTEKYNLPALNLDANCLVIITNHAWRGNVRELENFCLKLAITPVKERINVILETIGYCQAPEPEPTNGDQKNAGPEPKLYREYEALGKRLLLNSLRRSNSDTSKASARLGMTQDYFHEECRRLGIQLRQNSHTGPRFD